MSNLPALRPRNLKTFLHGLRRDVASVNLFPEHFGVLFDLFFRPMYECWITPILKRVYIIYKAGKLTRRSLVIFEDRQEPLRRMLDACKYYSRKI